MSPDPIMDADAPVLWYVIANGPVVVLTYSEDLDDTSVPDAGDFEVEVDAAPATVSAVALSRSLVSLELATPVDATNVVTVAYTPGTSPLMDPSANEAAAFTATEATNLTLDDPGGDLVAPVLQSLDVDAGRAHLVYDKTLDPAEVPATSAFAVVHNHSSLGVSTVTITDNLVTLALTTPAEADWFIYMAYAAPMSDPLADLAGNLVPSFTLAGAWNNTMPPPMDDPDPEPDPACDDGAYMGEVTASRWVFEDPAATGDYVEFDANLTPESIPVVGCTAMGYRAAAAFGFAVGGESGWVALEKDGSTRRARAYIAGATASTCSGVGGATCGAVDDGFHVTVPYSWAADTEYRLRLAFLTDNGDGTWEWEASVFVGASQTIIGTLTVPSFWGGLGPVLTNQVEWYGGPVNECRFLPAWSVVFARPTINDVPSPQQARNTHPAGATACPANIERVSQTSWRHLVGTAT